MKTIYKNNLEEKYFLEHNTRKDLLLQMSVKYNACLEYVLARRQLKMHPIHKDILVACLEYNSQDLNLLYLHLVWWCACQKLKYPSKSLLLCYRGKGFWAARQSRGLRRTCIYTVFFSLCFSNKNCGRLSPFIASTFLLRVLFHQRNIAEHLLKVFKNLKTWIAMNPFIYKHTQCPPNKSNQKLHSYKQVKNSEVRLLSPCYRNSPISRGQNCIFKTSKFFFFM